MMEDEERTGEMGGDMKKGCLSRRCVVRER
jgi:hypothetical protein